MANKSDFQQQVLAVVREIPPGCTASYDAIARAVGRPRAARAVARVMAANYDPTVPCHRVIRSDGTLGGYNRGGERQKRARLRAEGGI